MASADYKTKRNLILIYQITEDLRQYYKAKKPKELCTKILQQINYIGQKYPNKLTNKQIQRLDKHIRLIGAKITKTKPYVLTSIILLLADDLVALSGHTKKQYLIPLLESIAKLNNYADRTQNKTEIYEENNKLVQYWYELV